MIDLDVASVTVMTALVVITCGAIFLLDTVVHAGSTSARVWSVAFMAGVLAVLSYLVWSFVEHAWAAVAVGNGAFVTTTGCMWLGCRKFNDRRMRWSAAIVAGAATAAVVAVLLEGPEGGDWAGAGVMFVALSVFAALGAYESRRGDLGQRLLAYGLTFALGLQSTFYSVRIVVFYASGAESELFLTWFGTVSTSAITVVLTIIAVVTVSVLRATERGAPRSTPDNILELSHDGFFSQPSFEMVIDGLLHRGEHDHQQLAVIALRMDDLSRIAAAFGPSEARTIEERWRAGVQGAAPLAAVAGVATAGGIFVGVPSVSEAEARRLAGRLSQRVVDELTAARSTIVPVIGVGVALSHDFGDAAELVAAAYTAAHHSEASLDASVIVAAPEAGATS